MSGAHYRDGVPFTTERLVLRDITAEDVQAVHAYASDPEVCRFMVWGPNTLDDTQAFVREQLEALAAAEGMVYNKLVVDASGLVVGGAEFRVLSAEHRRGEFGHVYRRDQWGQGYATEVARAMVAFGFGELGLERISATCDPRNRASARVLEKAGLRLEGHLRHHLWVRGQWRDSLLYAVLSGDQ
jgi:RimJ/RimL family protein N-acetyltransferase